MHISSIQTPAEFTPASGGAGASRDAAKTAQTARDFEALLVAQVLKSALPPESMGLSDNEAGDHAVQFALEEFGKVIAAQGGMGLSRLVLQGMESPGPTQDR